MVAPLGLVDYNWTNTAESKQYIMAIMDKHASVRKKYGKLNIQIS